MLIQLNDIELEARQRSDLGDIQELADSLKEFGQLQPIVVSPGKEKPWKLVAGGRRLAAHLVIGKQDIDAVIKEEMTQLMGKRMELEENIRRKNLEWQEEVHAVEEIHVLMTAEYGTSWTVEKTAELIGKSTRMTKYAIELSKELNKDGSLAESDGLYSAMKKVQFKKEMQARQDAVLATAAAAKYGIPIVKATLDFKKAADFLDGLANESIDSIITDPPWSVDYQDVAVHKGSVGQFDDSPEAVFEETIATFPKMFRVLKPDRWMIMFWASRYDLFFLGRQALIDAGFEVCKRPLIWYKPNARYGSIQDPTRELNIQYETIFLCWKGAPRFNEQFPGDVFVYDYPGDRIHPTQKPVQLLRDFVRLSTISGETVCDPFAGSASTGVAAIQEGRNFCGCERDVRFFTNGSTWLTETLQESVAPIK